MTLPAVLAAGLAGVCAAASVRVVLHPAPPLAQRVRPYLVWGRSRLSLPPDIVREAGTTGQFGVWLERFAALIDGTGNDALELRLLQAGRLREVTPAQRVVHYRMRRLLVAVAGAVVAGLLAAGRGFGPMAVVALMALGGGGAVAWSRGRLDRSINERRARIRIELYTVEQLLAVQLRVGSSVPAAMRQLVSRSRGEVARELDDALRLHAGGMDLGESLRRVAGTTPEPHAMRCYRTLASGHERGAEVAAAMLALSEDVRDDRREALRRAATKGRALMLVPIVGILAPVLLLFVGAPLPWMVLREFG